MKGGGRMYSIGQKLPDLSGNLTYLVVGVSPKGDRAVAVKRANSAECVRVHAYGFAPDGWTAKEAYATCDPYPASAHAVHDAIAVAVGALATA